MKTNHARTSFDVYYEKNNSFLKSLALKLSKNQEDAQDLLQDTWLRIVENSGDYENRNKFRSWASVIMKNIFINDYRKKKRQGVNVDIEEVKLCSAINSDYLLANEDIYKAISELPHEMSKVFYLYLQGYTYEEISKHVDIPLGTVKSRIFCAKKRLQITLKSYSSHI